MKKGTCENGNGESVKGKEALIIGENGIEEKGKGVLIKKEKEQ